MPARIEVLFNKFIAGTCSEKEYEELMAFLQSNQHEALVRSMLQQVYHAQAAPVRTLPTFVWTKRIAAAAVIAGVIITGVWLTSRGKKDAADSGLAYAGNKAVTQRAEQKYILLPDSTQVWVNAASTLEFPESFSKDKREVTLTGEAYFDVKNADRIPFIIHTGNVTTRVLGTAFNIKAYPGQPDVIVAVKRGRVQVAKNEKVVATLEAGQRAKVAVALDMPVIKQVKEEEVAEWTVGKLMYDSLPLSTILQDIERTYNVTVHVASDPLQHEMLTTSFRREIGPKEALEIICLSVNARLSVKDGVYTIE